MTTRRLLAALCLSLAACSREPEVVRLDGSTGVMPLVQALADAFQQGDPGVTLQMGEGLGSGERIRAVTEGRIDAALASHGLDLQEIERQGLRVHEIGSGAIVFAAHAASVPVAAITEAQACDVYRGATTSWSALGGPDLPIVPHARPEDEVDAEVVRDQVRCWGELRLAPGVRVIAEAGDMAQAIASTPGSLGITTLTRVEQSGGAMRALSLDGVAPTEENVHAGRYRLTRGYYLVTRSDPPEGLASFLEFVRSPEGMAVVRANGAVPPR